MEKKVLVSIVIPVYNGDNYLCDAIDSALAQTHKSREVIVVDDGSVDGTERACVGYGDRIRYIRKDNGGVSSALNVGIREMRGEYFTWLAHDDMFYPDKIEIQVDALASATDKTTIVHGNYDLLDVKRNAKSHMRQEDSYTSGQLENSVFSLLMATLHASTPLIHKSDFERIGVFDERLPLTQDYDFLFRAMRGKRSVFIARPLLLSRLHGFSNKNTNEWYGIACAEQYKHYTDTLAYSEVCDMFVSPRAFYLRMAAMMKARYDTPDSDVLMSKIAGLPMEPENTELSNYLTERMGGKERKICIFGAGYHGKILKFELEHRGIKVACFGDNNACVQGTTISGLPCLSPDELSISKSDILTIIAADVSDAIETQLQGLGLKHIATKKQLDSLLLASPPII